MPTNNNNIVEINIIFLNKDFLFIKNKNGIEIKKTLIKLDRSPIKKEITKNIKSNI